MPKLKNGKQELFCQEYIIHLNATQSAINAGYSKKTAYSIGFVLLKKAEIGNRIKELMEKKLSHIIATQDEVLEYLTSTMRSSYKEEVIVTELKGNGISEASTMEKKISPKDRIRAAELLGKRYGLFTEKIDMGANVGVTIIDDIKAGEHYD